MHKTFYASGFLYRPKSAQILLQQVVNKLSGSSSWSIVCGINKKEERAHSAFQRIIYEVLKIKLKSDLIYPVYDYFHNGDNMLHYVFYAEVDEKQTFKTSKDSNFSWFAFKQIPKLVCNTQTKQDIVVADRVIKLKIRETQAKNVYPKEINQ
ncbi:MAG: NUDIX domain-containing protein [Candidatus Levyibacteriota bacterium]|nr:MAG: NUDIX domain-containing protein [Candidatus Levybacteria bacterium]